MAHLTSGLAKVVTDAAASGQLKNVEAGPVLTVDLSRVSGVPYAMLGKVESFSLVIIFLG